MINVIKAYLRLALSAICFVMLFMSCDTDDESKGVVTGVCSADDGTPISGMRVRFFDPNSNPFYLPNYCVTDINGVFTSILPHSYEVIEAQCYPPGLDTAYHSDSYRWTLKVDPKVTHRIVIPWKSEIVFNFAPKGPSVFHTRCRIRMEYKFFMGDFDSQAWKVQELEFDSDTIVTEGKAMFIPRNRQVQFQITKYTPDNFAIVSQLDTVFVPTSRKIYMMLKW